MQIIKPPTTDLEIQDSLPIIFLAGSIEQGSASNWQDKLQNRLSNLSGFILNPRRDDWDSTWAQVKENPNFEGQVLWELDGLSESDIIVMYFDPDTKSPITLLELGLFAESGKLIVCCPKGYWRYGNVDIVCREYSIPLYNDFEQFADRIILEISDFTH